MFFGEFRCTKTHRKHHKTSQTHHFIKSTQLPQEENGVFEVKWCFSVKTVFFGENGEKRGNWLNRYFFSWCFLGCFGVYSVYGVFTVFMVFAVGIKVVKFGV